MTKRITDFAEAVLTGEEYLLLSQLSTTVLISAATISAAASDNSFNDSANGFVAAGFAAGDRVNVEGFTGNVANNIFVGTITALTTGKMTIGGTDGDVIVDDAAGETVIITKWESKRAAAQDFTDLLATTVTAILPAFRGALARNSSALTTFNASGSDTIVTWAQEEYDTDGFHSTSSNTGRMTVPTGVSRVRLTGLICLSSLAAGNDVFVNLYKNGTLLSTGGFLTSDDTTLAGPAARTTFTSAPLVVVPGDYFEVRIFSPDDSSITVDSTSWFAIEVIEAVVSSVGGRGALVKKAADQTALNATSSVEISWDSEGYDDAGIHDTVTNNSRLTVPAGVSRVRVSGQLRLANVNADTWVLATITKNGSTTFDGAAQLSMEYGLTSPALNLSTPVVTVVPGDYFQLALLAESDTSIDIIAARSWFAMEILDGAPVINEPFMIAASDETTALTTGASKTTIRMPFAFTLTGIRASLSTAQTSGSIFTVDVNDSGASILSTKLTIDNGEKTSVTAATPAVISDNALADDAEITIDIDQVGDGTAKGLKVTLIGYRTD